MNEATFADGSVTLSPNTAVRVSQSGRWTLTFTAGENGLGLGDIIHIEIPQGFTPPQTDNPQAPGFVTLAQKTTEAEFTLVIGQVPGETTEDFNSDTGIYVIIERAPIRNGESFQLVYGAGDTQAFAPTFSGEVTFSVHIRTRNEHTEANYLPIRQNPTLTITAQELAQLEIVAPSGGQPGTPIELRVIGRDATQNRCIGWRGWFRVETDAEGILIPASQRNEDNTGEGVTLDVGLSDRSHGVVRLRVRESDSNATGVSNPIIIGKPAPFWGDLHACLSAETPARTELDFTLNVGPEPTHHKASFHFQTEEAQEGIGQPSSGFLRFSLPDANSDEMLPSHLLEIYSSWGNREVWGARRPDIRLDRHPHRTAQAVLGQGIIAGFAAGSNSRYGVGKDARRAEANRGYPAGLTAIFADSLDQNDLFSALRERRCYATTGARILLDMGINGHPMGRLVEVSADDEKTLRERRISARVYGTAPIDRIEVIRNNTEICTYRGDGLDIHFDWADQQDLTRIALPRNLRGGGLTCYYYLRITQTNGDIAWSSPVWFMIRK
ncbi:MAG: DUF3604 domain-containing protein [Candidatus Latescibacterota bacterium]